jgi:hypothetical protein
MADLQDPHIRSRAIGRLKDSHAYASQWLLSFGAAAQPSRPEEVAVVPYHRAAAEVVPFRLEAGAEGHQSQAGVEVRHPKRCTEVV